MLIQNASDSIRPPLRPSMRTRVSHHRVGVPEHQRRSRSVSWKFEGPDEVDHGAAHDPQWVRFVEAQFVHVVLADVLDVACGGVQAQPAAGVDVGHPQWPLPVENVGMAVEDRRQRLIQVIGLGDCYGRVLFSTLPSMQHRPIPHHLYRRSTYPLRCLRGSGRRRVDHQPSVSRRNPESAVRRRRKTHAGHPHQPPVCTGDPVVDHCRPTEAGHQSLNSLAVSVSA
jgi:hypothetical protein